MVGTRNVAFAAKEVDATLVYISTDYVFDGRKKVAMCQVDDITNPINEYGRTKLLGEKTVSDIVEEYYIIRATWVFGKYVHNFVFTMQNLAKGQDTLIVVND